MRIISVSAYLCGLLLLAAFANDARAEDKKPKDVKFSHEWKGSVADQKLESLAGDCIASKKSLEKVWTDWKLKDKLPDVDFDKELVVVVTSVGSQLNLTARLDDQGNLELLGMGTFDIRDGFRYVIATVNREGVKTVNKKPVPKE